MPTLVRVFSSLYKNDSKLEFSLLKCLTEVKGVYKKRFEYDLQSETFFSLKFQISKRNGREPREKRDVATRKDHQ